MIVKLRNVAVTEALMILGSNVRAVSLKAVLYAIRTDATGVLT